MKLTKLLIAGTLAVAANFAVAGGLGFANNTANTFTPKCFKEDGSPFAQTIPLEPHAHKVLPWILLDLDGAGTGKWAHCIFNDGHGDVYQADLMIHPGDTSGEAKNYDYMNDGKSKYDVTVDQSNSSLIKVTINQK